jgi:hypothetical protein
MTAALISLLLILMEETTRAAHSTVKVLNVEMIKLNLLITKTANHNSNSSLNDGQVSSPCTHEANYH